jgi:DNA-binding MarR family transcriptional regulator
MANKSAIDFARYIFTTGKLINDQILKIQNHCIASFGVDSQSDLSLTQLHVVRIVRKYSEISMRELAKQLAVSAPSASAMVDRLVEKGILYREHSTQDRRKVVVRISQEALRKAEAIESSILSLFEDLVQKIGYENAQKWCDVLASVKSVLDDHPPESKSLFKNSDQA